MTEVAKVLIWAWLALLAAIPPRRAPVVVPQACLDAPLAPECMP